MFDRFKNLEWMKLVKGAGIAAGGAVLTYLTQWTTGQDFGIYGPAIASILAVGVNFFRKLTVQ